MKTNFFNTFKMLCVIGLVAGCDKSKNINWKRIHACESGFTYKPNCARKTYSQEKLCQNIKTVPNNLCRKLSDLYTLNSVDLYKSDISIFQANNRLVFGDLQNKAYIVDKNTINKSSNIKQNGDQAKIDVKIVDLDSSLGFADQIHSKLILTSSLGTVQCYGPNNTLLWERKKFATNHIGLHESTVFLNEGIITLSGDGELVNIDLLNGEEKWLYAFAETVHSFDIHANANIILCRVNETICVFDLKGKVLHQQKISGIKNVLLNQKGIIYIVLSDKIMVFNNLNSLIKKQFSKVYDGISANERFFLHEGNLLSVNYSNNTIYSYLDLKSIFPIKISQIDKKVGLKKQSGKYLLYTKDNIVEFRV